MWGSHVSHQASQLTIRRCENSYNGVWMFEISNGRSLKQDKREESQGALGSMMDRERRTRRCLVYKRERERRSRREEKDLRQVFPLQLLLQLNLPMIE